jgi:hypothetical protein
MLYICIVWEITLSFLSCYVIKYCVPQVDLVVFVMFCIDDNLLFGFLDQYNYLKRYLIATM